MSITDTIGPRQFFSALILLFGLAMIGYGAYDYLQQSEAMQDAVETSATITESGTEEVLVGRAGTQYEPTATFNYRFQGKSYTSSNVFPTGSSPTYESRSEAEAVLERLERGETVTAYVVPSSPSSAFLKDTPSKIPYTFLGLGGLTVLIGGFNLVKASVRSG